MIATGLCLLLAASAFALPQEEITYSESGAPDGAIGVGGGSGDQDEQCARAALI